MKENLHFFVSAEPAELPFLDITWRDLYLGAAHFASKTLHPLPSIRQMKGADNHGNRAMPQSKQMVDRMRCTSRVICCNAVAFPMLWLAIETDNCRPT